MRNNLKKEDEIIHYLYELEFATINNLYSRNAARERGSLLNADRTIHSLLRKQLVRPIPMNDRPRYRLIETFYYLTKKGAKRVDADGKVKTSWESKSIDSIYHESIVRDVARAFLDYYDFSIMSLSLMLQVTLSICNNVRRGLF